MGATPKGELRRAAIVRAAADLVAAGGPDAVSHRTAAAAAGVPLAATTYYFRDLADLLAAALETLGTRELDEVAALVGALPRRRRSAAATAGLVADVVVGPGRRSDADLLAYYERFLTTGRHPAVRPVLAATRRRLDALVQEVLDRSGRGGPPPARLVAVFDGTVLSALVEGPGRAREEAEAAVAELLADTGVPHSLPPPA